jgi:hypothetical protein
VTIEGNRNALLALHYREGNTADTAAHVESCAECRSYLADIGDIERALAGGSDETPPADLRARVLSQATASAQLPARRPAAAGAAPLLAMLPVMAAFVGVVLKVGTYLASSPYWEMFAPPDVPGLAPFGMVALLLALVGGLASLAVAPVLVLENKKA